MPPSVSIIIPCYNEQTRIKTLLQAIYAQTYSRQEMEVVIADGLSTDGTRREIELFLQGHPDLPVTVVDNPQRHIPVGLNRALAHTRGGIIVRLDAHSIPSPEYVARSVSDLLEGRGENVGGVWEIRPGAATWAAESIAAAAAHPLGVGDALYRQAGKPAHVDTVPFGAFKRELLAQVGFFDESLLTNEDYEFNARIRKAGGKIWLDPAIRSVYFARATFPELARQYARYGYWKWRMLRRYPETLRWRQALPPLLVAGLILGALLGIFVPPIRLVWAAGAGFYGLILVLAGLRLAIGRKKASLVLGFPAAVAVMHISWGAGFLWSMIRRSIPRKAWRA
jgi:succinoglycan biosynthesis protein ExoA